MTDLAFEKISSAIVYGRLDLGEPLSETELAKALNMSRVPIKNAINQLKMCGLVEIVPQSGTYVFTPTREKIIELSEFRLLLEQQAVKLAVERDRDKLLADLDKILTAMRDAWAAGHAWQIKQFDTEFHWCFIRRAGNSYLEAAYSDISLLVEALRYRFMDTVVYRNKAFEEHQRIVELLAAGRVNKVVRLLADHIQRTKEFHANVQWTSGRARRKLYRVRDYSNILFADNVPDARSASG